MQLNKSFLLDQWWFWIEVHWGSPELLETFRSRFEPHSTLINSLITKFLVYSGNLIALEYSFFLSFFLSFFCRILAWSFASFFNYTCMTFWSSIKYTSCFLSPRMLTKNFVLIICRLDHHLTDKDTKLHITLWPKVRKQTILPDRNGALCSFIVQHISLTLFGWISEHLVGESTICCI